MRVNKGLLIPYSLAIGMFNLIFTAIIVLVVSHLMFDFPLTWGLYAEHYAIGYVILWVLNLDTIKE